MVQAIDESELIHWKDINVKKVFWVERENQERVSEKAKDRKLVRMYRELASKESKCVTIDNNGSSIVGA